MLAARERLLKVFVLQPGGKTQLTQSVGPDSHALPGRGHSVFAHLGAAAVLAR